MFQAFFITCFIIPYFIGFVYSLIGVQYEIKATAYDAAGNSSWVSVSVPVNEKGSEPADKLTLEVDIDTSKVKVGEPFDINITANGGVGEKIISCTVNNESVAVENSKASYTPEQFGTYEIAVSAVDEAGSNITKTINTNLQTNYRQSSQNMIY